MIQQKCSQRDCEEPAVWKYTWTGPQFACQKHMEKAVSIASAMGFPTVERTMERVDEPEGTDSDE